jgi:Flp pilus assembly pilin Flp
MRELIVALKKLSTQETGAAVVEYAILGIFLTTACIIALPLLGQRIASLFKDVTLAL